MDTLKIYKRLYKHFGPQHWWPTAQNMKHETLNMKRFEICVGAILTQNTAWKNVEKAIGNLCAAKAINPEAILQMRKEKLASLIRPAGYFNQKAKKLKIFSKWFLDNGKNKRGLPELRAELLDIWGVGPETADSMALYAFGLPTFVVDAYTKRMCSVLGRDFGNYDGCKKYFEDSLPRSSKLYNEYHTLIVAWGKIFAKDQIAAKKILLKR